jgi:hypothetical protein
MTTAAEITARLGRYAGSHDPEHRRRWLAGMLAGRDRAPRCIGTCSDGRPCDSQRILGTSYCRHHISGELRDRVDEDRLVKLHRVLQSNRDPNGSVIRTARRAIATIARRRAHKAHKKNPELAIVTLILSDDDEFRVAAWLEERAIERDAPLVETGLVPTNRCWDRCRWTAFLHLTGRIQDRSADLRLKSAVRDDVWWKRKAKAAEPKPAIANDLWFEEFLAKA